MPQLAIALHGGEDIISDGDYKQKDERLGHTFNIKKARHDGSRHQYVDQLTQLASGIL